MPDEPYIDEEIESKKMKDPSKLTWTVKVTTKKWNFFIPFSLQLLHACPLNILSLYLWNNLFANNIQFFF